MTEVLLEAIDVNKHFGSVKALQQVSIRIKKGSVHALLGENGAGKSTLVKCIMGYYRPDAGELLYKNKQQVINSPQQAAHLGIGMVYQHFTLINNMTIAENIVLAQPKLPKIINWAAEIEVLQKKMQSMPFQFDLQRKVSTLSVGEKQKVEIVKQLLLNAEMLILDEPTSVLNPSEADEVLSKIYQMTRTGELSVLMITHKFREVMAYADDVTVLRKGKFAGSVAVSDANPKVLADMMIGEETINMPPSRELTVAEDENLIIKDLVVRDDFGMTVVDHLNLSVKAGEIVGIAGVSGNGQKQLVEALAGQRSYKSGEILLHRQRYTPEHKNALKHGFYCLPEEPLKNACVGTMSVGENIVMRKYNQPPFVWLNVFLNRSAIFANATKLIAQYGIRTSGPDQDISSLSGGNVQRAVLARELSQAVSVLVVSNPVFGLDFKAVADIHGQIIAARNKGAAILLLSEDLDEVLELSDRLLVMSGGKLVYETYVQNADINTIGQHMAGH